MMLLSCDAKYNPNLILQYGYDYDFLGQLISADYANQNLEDESYTYDSNGNCLTANGDEYTTGTNNELTSDGAYTYTYDDEGNRLTKTNSTNRELYTWDYRNRLTSVTKQTYNAETGTWKNVQIVEYTYDYNNVWIRKTLDSNGDGTADSKSIFIPENYQTTVQIDNGAVPHHYLWTPNQQDKLLADVTADNVLWTLTDHLGSIRDVVGTTTNTHIIYDAYGNIISGTNPILFAYTGKAFDVSTQFQNNINRWYDASIGRWLSTDPIGFEGNDTNLYRYVGNASFQFRDIWGFEVLIALAQPTQNRILGKNLPNIPGPDETDPSWNSYETFENHDYQFPPLSDVNVFLIPDTNLMDWQDILYDWAYTPSRYPQSYYQFGPLSPLSQKIWKSSRREFMQPARDAIKEAVQKYCNCNCKGTYNKDFNKPQTTKAQSYWYDANLWYAPTDVLQLFHHVEAIGSYYMNYKITVDCERNTVRFLGVLLNVLSNRSASFKIVPNGRNVYMSVIIDQTMTACE